ncbi:hypothetical protein [Aeromicrobium choanae]|uniref:Uncharacterized protein n=1 Tax=Aeromicrobium choanae TaxID=1736691 RepID=A0A1T4Z821_9ACTN|nr:hypothetical protein [Aeromicrobium choanae]SKB10086.1 hypothetical protein SAMN06295964_3092 [Aeromicrobium choanae]
MTDDVGEKPGWVSWLVLGLSTWAFALVLAIDPIKPGVARWLIPLVWFVLGSHSVLRSWRLRRDTRALDANPTSGGH